MKYLLANLGRNLPTLACLGIAGYLAIHNNEAWGWFLFIGLLCAGWVSFESGEK